MAVTDSAMSPARKQYGRLRWDGGEVIEADGINLTLTTSLAIGPSSDSAIAMYKRKPHAQFYCDRLATIPARSIVELGIKFGGSAIFFTHLLPIEKYVGIELAGGAPYLDNYIARMGLKETMRPYYNTSQDDAARLTEILDDEFGTDPIDLVIDDASHAYAATLASFEVLFPRIRPGGYFIFEDWSCHALAAAHSIGAPPVIPLHNLLFDLALFSSLYPGIIPAIEVYPTIAFLRRGPEKIDGAMQFKEWLAVKDGPKQFRGVG